MALMTSEEIRNLFKEVTGGEEPAPWQMEFLMDVSEVLEKNDLKSYNRPCLKPGELYVLDWKKVEHIIKEEGPDITIYAGLKGDWGNTSDLIYSNGIYYKGGLTYVCSLWATPTIQIMIEPNTIFENTKEIACYIVKENAESGVPDWWGNGRAIER